MNKIKYYKGQKVVWVADCKLCVNGGNCPMPCPPYWIIELQKEGCEFYKMKNDD